MPWRAMGAKAGALRGSDILAGDRAIRPALVGSSVGRIQELSNNQTIKERLKTGGEEWRQDSTSRSTMQEGSWNGRCLRDLGGAEPAGESSVHVKCAAD